MSAYHIKSKKKTAKKIKARTLVFHKPFEVLSQFTDTSGRSTLSDFIPIAGVYAAGRLDYRSEGLLLLSDNGSLIQRLTDPKFKHTKTYLAQVEGEVTSTAVQRLQHEILLPGEQTRLPRVEIATDPGYGDRVKPVRAYHPTSWLKMSLQEGKKHQVRRMTAAVGFPTLRLIRVAIAGIELGALPSGQWRWLTSGEVEQISRITGISLPHQARPEHKP